MDDRMSEPGRVTTSAEIRVPLERAWSALADANQLGSFLGLRFGGAFLPGTRLAVLPEAPSDAAPGVTGTLGEALVEKLEPPHLLAIRWRRRLPGAPGTPGDPAAPEAPGTNNIEALGHFLVEFRLVETRTGVSLTLTESGYDADPGQASSRAEGFVYWVRSLHKIRQHLEGAQP